MFDYLENNYYYKKYGLNNIQLIKRYNKLCGNALTYELRQGYNIDIETIINDYFIEKQRYSEIEFSKEHLIYDNLSSISIGSYLRFGDYADLEDFSNAYMKQIFNDYNKWIRQYKRMKHKDFIQYTNTLHVTSGLDNFCQALNNLYIFANTDNQCNTMIEISDIIEYIKQYADVDYLHSIRANYYLLCQIFKTDIDKETVFLNDYLGQIQLNKELCANYYVHKITQICVDIPINSIDTNTFNTLFIPTEIEQTSEMLESVDTIDLHEFWK